MTITKRALPRAAQVVLDHGLAPYEPQAGDIVMAFHLFNEFDEAADTLDKRRSGAQATSSLMSRQEEVAKFRPCLVVYAKGNEALLVPVSSARDRRGRHLEINEPSELESLGLAPHKPAYAQTLAIAKYDCRDNPLILPIPGADGQPSWLVGRAPPELVKQAIQDVSRQKKHGRLEKIPTRFARDVPAPVAEEMQRLAQEARARNAPRRSIARRTDADATSPNDAEMERRRRAVLLHAVQEKAAQRLIGTTEPTRTATVKGRDTEAM